VVGSPSPVSVSLHAQGASWLNQVERFFAELTRKRIRRGRFRSVRELEKAIQDYVRAQNHRVRPVRVDSDRIENYPESAPL
jgi:hypothetical protein